ncbi:MAG TPA: HupE/UreJ family protein, partial [Gammaproteobacteria bacterium]|nr:HupE/UreJ family protein [Gammaproteobacteria bacterium]
FSFGLRNTLQLAGDHVLAALLAFNLGIELGQLLVLAALVPVLNLLFRFVVAERVGVIVLSVIVGHTAWHWMAERVAALRQFHF